MLRPGSRMPLSIGLAALILLACAVAKAADSPIPYRQYTLDNGLTLIVHEDHSAPLVAVNIWYHVGSKDETPGRTGLAHLFEHLMYQGSEHFQGEFFGPFEQVGATRMNGTTDNDRTNYFVTVPREALDLALWMESDRMAHLLGAIDQARLDEQRAVVKNEKRQRENRPYGKVWETIARLSFPEGHPYRWPVIGAMEDLDAASLEDAKAWFRQHYGAANAVLVVAGDVQADAVVERVRHYFGAAPPGPPQLRQQRWIAPRDTPQRAVLEDRVAQPRLYLVWNTPSRGEDAADRLELLGDLLAGNASAALNRELIQRRNLATQVSAFQLSRELAGQFWISADAAPGVTLPELESAILEVLKKLGSDGVPRAALETAKTLYRADFLRGLEELGGFGGRADVLAAGAIYSGDPGDYQRTLRVIAATRPGDIRPLLRQWLGDGFVSLQVLPRPDFQAGEDIADRSRLPEVAAPADFTLPPIQRARLDNGLQLILLQRPGMPLVEFSLQLPAGHGHSADRPGLAGFTAALLEEGSTRRDAGELSSRLRQLGARFRAQVNLDTAELQLAALSEQTDDSLALLAEIALQPAMSEAALQRVRERRLAAIAREASEPQGLAARLLPGLLLPAGHPYAQPHSGLGRSDVVRSLDRSQILAFYQRHYQPDGSSLVAVGDLDMDTLRRLAERSFGRWKSDATAPAMLPRNRSISTAAVAPDHTEEVIYLVHRPDASQATLRVARRVARPHQGDAGLHDAALDIVNGAFGGSFSSRINLSLREDKGWSYGAYSRYLRHAEADWLLISTAVQAGHTGDAVQELHRQWRQFTTEAPLTEAEHQRVTIQLIRSRSGSLATRGALRNELARQLRLGLPDDALSGYDNQLRAVDLETARGIAAGAFGQRPEVWLVIGDRDTLRPQLEALPWVLRVVEFGDDVSGASIAGKADSHGG